MIFHTTKAVFDENMYPQCPDGSHVNIPAIETSVLLPLDSYLDRDNNIPPEDGDQPPPPPPVEMDSIWHHGHPMPYVLGAPCDGDDDDSQPPSLPPSPGLSYCTPRTSILRHSSVTLSHCSSGGSRLRSQTLTEQVKSPPHEREACDNSGYYWDWLVTMSDGTTQVQPVSPVTFGNLVHAATSGEPAEVSSIPENPRILARHQALESPTVPQSSAIPQTEIASYQREWHDGACSGKYSYIPSYMGWRRGEQLELAGPSIPTEWPLSLVPGPSA